MAATFVGEMVTVAGLGLVLGLPAGWWTARLALGGFKRFLPAGGGIRPGASAWVGLGWLAGGGAGRDLLVWGWLVRADLAALGREAALQRGLALSSRALPGVGVLMSVPPPMCRRV